MQLAEPLVSSWKAHLDLGFENRNGKTILSRKQSEGPLVVQKALYPEGDEVCHAIVVHPPGGIAGGDNLELQVEAKKSTSILLTTPGAAKWYRSAGPWAEQKLQFDVEGTLEWLPRETIVFDGALAKLECEIRLGEEARFIGWEVMCLGRTGSGERFNKGKIRIETSVIRGGKPLWIERGTLHPGLMASPAGLAGHSVFGTLVATEVPGDVLARCREIAPTTALPGLTLARYLGDSTEQALRVFTEVWKILRPAVTGREAIPPRIWST
jgi:urease accessory protein